MPTKHNLKAESVGVAVADANCEWFVNKMSVRPNSAPKSLLQGKYIAQIFINGFIANYTSF